MFRFILLVALLANAAFSQAHVPNDPIQRCLDVRRLVDVTVRAKMVAKEPGVFPFKFHKISSSELLFDNPQGNMKQVIGALRHQLRSCHKYKDDVQTITIADKKFKRYEWCLNVNQKMLKLAKAAKGNFNVYLSTIKEGFDWYKSDGWPQNHGGFKKGDFQFTAYYAPAAIEARSRKGNGFIYPIYRNPGVVSIISEGKNLHVNRPLCGVDPISKTPRGYCMKNANGTYSIAPDREEIERGALDPKYVIGYVKNANDPAFLMLQGSGSIKLDGKPFHINYDGANGRPRTMLGRIVQCAQDPYCGGNLDIMEKCAKDPKCYDEAKLRCNLSQAVRQTGASEMLIRRYLDHLNPVKASALRNRDQSYVFFSKEKGGPYGSENISLTPHASCATDHQVIPIGTNLIYQFKQSTSWCIAQDAGGAIKGAHVDIYTGEGDLAGIEANALNDAGTLYVALPKTQALIIVER